MADVAHTDSSWLLLQVHVCLLSEKLDDQIHNQHDLMHLKNEVIKIKKSISAKMQHIQSG